MTATPAHPRAARRPGPRRGTNPRDADTDLTLPSGRSTVVTTGDGARLAVTIAGEATDLPSVVLPHCWTGARAVGVPVARRLVAAGHQVVLYDQRGHGESSVGSEPVSVERLADDLAEVVTHLDLVGTVLAGHSMGGMTVMGLACRHPEIVRDRVRGLALIATAAHGLSAGGRDRFWRMVLWREAVNRLMVHRRTGRLLVRGTFGASPLRAHLEATRALFVTTPPDVRRDCATAMGAMDLRTALGSVAVPAVVVLGERDLLIVNSLTRTIAEHLAGATVVELPGAGHMLPLERPDEVARAIRGLVA